MYAHASGTQLQYEGGAMEGGRGPSIWDNFTHQYPGMYTSATRSKRIIVSLDLLYIQIIFILSSYTNLLNKNNGQTTCWRQEK
jgi:hypothetical protein